MNPRDSARSGWDAIRSFFSPGNVLFLAGLVAILVLASFVCAPSEGDRLPADSTTDTVSDQP